MATMLPSLGTRTMLSVSLMLLEASGSVKVPRVPRLMFLFFSVTTLTDGCERAG
jgi:hypothetical protein